MIKKCLAAALALAVALALPALPASAKPRAAWSAVRKYVCCYGRYTSAMKLFDLAILEPTEGTPTQLAKLGAAGVWRIGYLLVGECDDLEVGDGLGPGGYASWYLNDRGAPLRNGNYGSYYVDPGNPAWRERTLARGQQILDMGFDGLFLDMLDTVDVQDGLDDGMISLVRLLRERFPAAKLVANRGFSILEGIAPSIDGLMFENFASEYEHDTRRYRTLTADEREANLAVVTRLLRIQSRQPLLVLTLDYAKPANTAAIQRLYAASRKRGFRPYVSTVDLRNVFVR